MRTPKAPAEPRTLWSGAVTVSTRPWPHTRDWAYLLITGAHSRQTSLPAHGIIEGWCRELAAAGYEGVRTGAVGPDIAESLCGNGFRPVQSLSLLTADLTCGPLPVRPDRSIRPVRNCAVNRQTTVDRILLIDAASFGEKWCMDSGMLADAARATHRSRLFTARDATGSPVGFVLVGMTDSTGFVQRLAVLPGHRRGGVALQLMGAAHRWLRMRGCTTSVVNTETTNEAALSLYRRCGYAELSYGLQVLERPLTSGAARP